MRTLTENFATYKFFPPLSAGSGILVTDPLRKYEYLLHTGNEVKCSVYGVDIDLMDEVQIGSINYQAAEIIEHLDTNILELTLRKVA